LTFWDAFFLAIGLLFILEGLGYAVSPRFMRRALMQVWELEDKVLQLMGFIAIFVGLVVIWFIGG